MDRRAETVANINLRNKSEDSATVDRSFESLEVFRHVLILDTHSDIHGWSRKIHLEAKSMKAKFNVRTKEM